jgi:nitrogen fixation/metabolism regulation signal transduction histidine kinase
MNTFRFRVAVRALFLTLTLAAFAWGALHSDLYATTAILFALAVGQLWGLIVFVEQTNRHVVRFLEAVKYGDTMSLRAGGAAGGSFQELAEAFSVVATDFERIRREKEEQYLALQTIVHHVPTGLLSFDETGKIELINPAARRLLNIPFLSSLDGLGASYPQLVEAVRNSAADTALVKIVVAGQAMQIKLNTTRFRQRGREITLVSLQNIVGELEEQEIAAWQKLIRVLTHEIMNSVAPITSLAQTVESLIGEGFAFAPDDDDSRERAEDMRQAAQTIRRRGEGLLRFVENFRALSRIPEPECAPVRVGEIVKRIEILFQPECAAHNIEWSVSIEPPEMEIIADSDLLEQALINLVQNAVHAVVARGDHSATRRVAIEARQNPDRQTTVEIGDTGMGILPEALDKIFVPFFTTKPDGSGIGLSFVKEILRKHGASITVASDFGEGARFIIRFGAAFPAARAY